MWLVGVRLDKVLRRTVQALLHQPGEVAHGAIPVHIVLKQFLTHCPDLIIVQGDQAQFTVQFLDHVHDSPVLCLRRRIGRARRGRWRRICRWAHGVESNLRVLLFATETRVQLPFPPCYFSLCLSTASLRGRSHNRMGRGFFLIKTSLSSLTTVRSSPGSHPRLVDDPGHGTNYGGDDRRLRIPHIRSLFHKPAHHYDTYIYCSGRFT